MPTSVHNRNHVHGNKTDGVPFPRQYFTDQKKTYVQKCSELCGFFPNCFHEPDGQRSIAEKHHTAYLETNHAPTGNDLQKRPN